MWHAQGRDTPVACMSRCSGAAVWTVRGQALVHVLAWVLKPRSSPVCTLHSQSAGGEPGYGPCHNPPHSSLARMSSGMLGRQAVCSRVSVWSGPGSSNG